ncbi:TrmH family RNA methyltransferase [Aureliella helgolandensis]|uniref:23S rRNA (Adenosine(1067)-2'-O)-methyltransferase n=1 Tax=Aureliella helgolandensis TaxID=2527968 RepID=A0A518GD78_9BACT|nr:TrmH family RNA methyltransferase [Aureliella helgolandensis]QDV26555.1 23S rRNA (adenosine(1067)-2'-O)-methyltransferase [Aureliella helgolandensis]
MISRIPPCITSPHNPKVKLAQRLRDSKTRRKLERFLIDGEQEILAAHAAGVELECVFADSLDGAPPPAWLTGLEPLYQPVTRQILSRISYGDRQDAPVAIAVSRKLSIADLDLHAPKLLLVLDRTEKPGNIGACLRSAAACGVDAVVLTNPTCELFNPNAIRASRGAIFKIPIAHATVEELLDACAAWKIPVCTARVDAQHQLWECEFQPAVAVVFGNEANGLGEEWDVAQVLPYRIPMSSSTDSLNLSISAAVTLYEAVRQQAEFDPRLKRV